MGWDKSRKWDYFFKAISVQSPFAIYPRGLFEIGKYSLIGLRSASPIIMKSRRKRVRNIAIALYLRRKRRRVEQDRTEREIFELLMCFILLLIDVIRARGLQLYREP